LQVSREGVILETQQIVVKNAYMNKKQIASEIKQVARGREIIRILK
jgi:hypothetical protein